MEPYRKMLGNGLLARSTVCRDRTRVSDRIGLIRFAGKPREYTGMLN